MADVFHLGACLTAGGARFALAAELAEKVGAHHQAEQYLHHDQ